MTLIESIIIAVVEGITEFLPISSTGHMIITERLLLLPKDDVFTKLFTVAIQLGAILSVVVLYWKKFFDFSKWQFYLKLVVAVIPALGIGFYFQIKLMNYWKVLQRLLLLYWQAVSFCYLSIKYLTGR